MIRGCQMSNIEPMKFLICTPRRCVGVEVYLHSFLTLALDEGEWSNYPPGKPPPMPTEYKTRWALDSVWTVWKRENSYNFRESHDSFLANWTDEKKIKFTFKFECNFEVNSVSTCSADSDIIQGGAKRTQVFQIIVTLFIFNIKKLC